jgi:hypothetical protein
MRQDGDGELFEGAGHGATKDEPPDQSDLSLLDWTILLSVATQES